MKNNFSFPPFKLEDHVYHNEAFAELCKDAVRAFNGTPVCELPPPRFAGSGVYAIYCTAKTGLYERYGKKVNRMGYNVPIYVGKAVPQGWRQSRTAGVDSLSFDEQMKFWIGLIKSSIGLEAADFQLRSHCCNVAEIDLAHGVHWLMQNTYQPLWNKIFGGCKTTENVAARWARLHSVRFRSKADKTFQGEVRKLMDVA